MVMTTRDYIVQTADNLIREKGYNAFSFVDIAHVVGIKKPSIHHHFPRKTDLGIAVIDYHIEKLNKVKEVFLKRSAVEKLDQFFAIYSEVKCQNQICLVGSLSTDFNTLEPEIQQKLKEFSGAMLDWVSGFLKAGRNDGIFRFNESPRTKAILMISGMIAIVALSRLTKDEDFELVTKAIKQELLK
jgi:TetR/AcrR family transcriptional repressor of nem operon